jgi:hypothetical protein
VGLAGVSERKDRSPRDGRPGHGRGAPRLGRRGARARRHRADDRGVALGRSVAQARGALVELGLGLLDLDLELGLAEDHASARGHHDHGRQPGAVDERAVRRSEVLELDAVLVGADGEVTARDLLVADRDVGVLPADDELGDQLDALPGARARANDQERHARDTNRNPRTRPLQLVEHGQWSSPAMRTTSSSGSRPSASPTPATRRG